MSKRIEYFFSDIAEFKKGINYSSTDYVDEYNGIPFISIKCLLKGGGFDFEGIKYLKDRFDDTDKLKIGELLFAITDLTRAGDIVGSPMLVPFKYKNSVASMDLVRVKTKEQLVCTEYLYHLMMTDEIRNYFVNHSAGSTVLHLEVASIPKLQLNLPPLPTQRKIARILTTADAVIEKTQAAIAKYKAIKQGMLHDLFTRGILLEDYSYRDKNGKVVELRRNQLRPKYQDAPELYKESKLGWIPKEWNVEIFGEQVELVHGHQFRNYDFTEFGIPVVKIGQVKPENLDLSDSSYVSFDRTEEFKSEIIRNGDVLMALTGATLGKACLVHGLNGIVLQNYRVGRFEPKISINDIDKTFLYYLLIAGELLNQIFSKVNSGAQGNIGKADFEKATFKKPEFSEQLLFAQRLQSIDNKIQTEQAYLHKLQQIKAGLMADLLSGKKEVSVDSNETLIP